MSHVARADEKKPLPVKTKMRVTSSVPRVEIWNKLTKKEKELAYHLQRAARWGRAILFHQNHRHGLTMKDFFENVLSARQIKNTKKALGESAFHEFVAYVAKFQDLGGPYSPSNRKYVLEGVPPLKIKALFKDYLERKRTVEVSPKTLTEIVKLMTDPEFEVLRAPEDASGKELAASGGNLYAKGITGIEVTRALKKGFNIELNCRVVKKRGKLVCEKQTVKTPGPVGSALTQVVRELRRAMPLALSENQRRQIEYTIRYFQTGDVNDFREANIAWVKDGGSSKVDFMMGFVEVYSDYQGRIGSWESYVQFIDPETTRISQELARNAQYFEDLMPYGNFKKKFPPNYAPPAIMVYYFQEIAETRSGGYNLPNFDDIRRDVGFKNVIRLDLPGEDKNPKTRRVFEEAYEEFMPKDLVARAMKYREKQWRVLVQLHEIIGHGSGTYDINKYGPKEDPISALGASGGSALEEQRADLAALVFAGDFKLVETGIYSNVKEAKEVRDAMYDTYVATFLMRVSRERSLAEAHQRGHWLLIKKLLDAKAVAWVPKTGSGATTVDNQVLKVVNYDLFQAVSRDLLHELQRIKANRDEAALKLLLATHAPLEAINEPWAQAVIRRGDDLMYNAGSVEQPWVIVRDFLLEPLGGDTLVSVAPHWFR